MHIVDKIIRLKHQAVAYGREVNIVRLNIKDFKELQKIVYAMTPIVYGTRAVFKDDLNNDAKEVMGLRIRCDPFLNEPVLEYDPGLAPLSFKAVRDSIKEKE